jgi:hypothetical protein
MENIVENILGNFKNHYAYFPVNKSFAYMSLVMGH